MIAGGHSTQLRFRFPLAEPNLFFTDYYYDISWILSEKMSGKKGLECPDDEAKITAFQRAKLHFQQLEENESNELSTTANRSRSTSDNSLGIYRHRSSSSSLEKSSSSFPSCRNSSTEPSLGKNNESSITSGNIAAFQKIKTFSPTSSEDNPFREYSSDEEEADELSSKSQNSYNPESPVLPPRNTAYSNLTKVVRKDLESTLAEFDKPQLPPRPVKKPPLPSRPKTGSNDSSQTAADDRNILQYPPSPSALSFGSRLLSSDQIRIHTTDTNRSPPYSKFNATISSRHQANCVASSRGFVATGGMNTKIWNAQTGENTATFFVPKQEVRVTSLAFVPSAVREFDGKYLWIGFSDGSLWMVNIFTQDIIEKRLSAHNYPITFILRYRLSLLSIDEHGVLQVWTETQPRNRQLFNAPTQFGGPENDHIGKIVSLEGKPRTIRIGSKLNCATIVEAQLWTCRGRYIEITFPFESGGSTRRIEVPQNLGLITCITSNSFAESPVWIFDYNKYKEESVGGSRIYTGHIDGKVVEWDAKSRTRKRIFDTGSYRISAIQGVSGRILWIGFGTGKMIVIDVGDVTSNGHEGDPVSLKEWHAERNEAISLLAIDPDSILHVGQLIIASMSKNGNVRLWDALVPNDFFDMEARRREAEYCVYEDISILMLSWNIDASKPEALQIKPDDFYVLDKWANQVQNGADIIVVGFQEVVDLESKKRAARGIFKNATKKPEISNENDIAHRARAWREKLEKVLRDNFKQPYSVIQSKKLVGLFSCIFVKEHLVNHISHVSTNTVSTGFSGNYGNKGAIISRFCFKDSSFCFITTHLPAHQTKVGKRNVDAITILRADGLPPAVENKENAVRFVRGGDGKMVLDHEFAFFFGDLNYRIDIDRDKVLKLIEGQQWQELLQGDQLQQQLRNHNPSSLLKIFTEGPIEFAPTYKYDPGTDNYDTSDKRRTPAWCDRILYRDGSAHHMSSVYNPKHRLRLEDQNIGRLAQKSYSRLESKISDHKPITSIFNAKVKSLDMKKWNSVQEKIKADWESHFYSIMWDGMVRWMVSRIDDPNSELVDRMKIDSILRDSNGDLTLAMEKFTI